MTCLRSSSIISRRPMWIAVVVCSCCLPQVGAQVVVWNNTGTGGAAGDWFDAGNWFPSTVPGPLDNAQVRNGGEARATSATAPGPIATSRIEVGKNGGTGSFISSGVDVSTEGDFDVGEIGATFATGQVIVNGSGSVTIESTSAVFIGTGGTGDLDVGQVGASMGAQATGVGTVLLQNISGNIDVARDLDIGQVGGEAGTVTNGTGTLTVDNAAALNVGLDIDIGQVNAAGQATGTGSVTILATPNVVVGSDVDVARTIALAGSVTDGNGMFFVEDATLDIGFANPLLPGSLTIGAANPSLDGLAVADGAAMLERVNVTVADAIHVGELAGGGSNAANSAAGTFTLIESLATAPQVDVAVVADDTAGTASGHLQLTRSLLDVTSALALGSNSTLAITLDGTTRADGSGASTHYGAIDAVSAALDGNLQVSLGTSFTPVAGDSFTLIAGGSINGNFAAVTLPTLADGLSWSIAAGPTNYLLAVVGDDLTGDYNGDGTVNAADYTVWRDTLGSSTQLAADGNNNQMIDAGDYLVWKNNFGATLVAGAAAFAVVPEANTILLLATAIVLCGTTGFGNRSRHT